MGAPLGTQWRGVEVETCPWWSFRPVFLQAPWNVAWSVAWRMTGAFESVWGVVEMRSQNSYCLTHSRWLGALERRREGDHQLRDHVEAEARDLAGEAFTRFMSELYKRIYHLICRRATQGACLSMVSYT